MSSPLRRAIGGTTLPSELAMDASPLFCLLPAVPALCFARYRRLPEISQTNSAVSDASRYPAEASFEAGHPSVLLRIDG